MSLGGRVSHHKLAVGFHVTLQQLIEWSKQTLEAVSVDRCYLQLCLGNHIGLTDTTLQEGKLAEVVTSLVLHDLLRGLACVEGLGGNSLTRNDDVENIALFTFLNDTGLCLEGLFLDGVANLASLIRIDTLQDWHTGKEILVLGSLLLGSILHDVVEGVPVKLPQSTVGL